MGEDFGFYRLENGLVQRMDHPLGQGIAGRVAKGEIVRVTDASGKRLYRAAPGEDGDAEQDLLARAEAAEAERDALLAELEALKASAGAAKEQAETHARHGSDLTNGVPPAPAPAKATKAAQAKA